MNIVWVGPYFSDKALFEKKSANQAAAKWSRGLLDALRKDGHSIYAISHCPEQLWPRGKVFWQSNSKEWFREEDACVRIGYPNVPFIRPVWLSYAYMRALIQLYKRQHIDVLLTYNSCERHTKFLVDVSKKLGIPAFPIILDGDDPRLDNWARMLRENRNASGLVVLSQWVYDNFPAGVPAGGETPMYHMDGGNDRWRGVPPKLQRTPFTIVHSGALDKWRGLDFLSKVISLLKEPKIRFILTGRCDKSELMSRFGRDARICIKGLVSHDELDKICREASMFISTRDPDNSMNVVNFPSKIPNYISYGRPVVATWMESLSKDYRDVLEVPEKNTPESFAQKVMEVFNWPNDKFEKRYYEIRDWFNLNKTWACQATGLIEWIQGISHENRNRF